MDVPGTRAALDSDLTVDVAIVGGGFTGLWTAYYLLKQDRALRVAILEKEHVGFGASGRNGGWCSGIFPISPQRVAKLSSQRAALHLQSVLNETVDEVGRVVKEEGIDARFRKAGYLSMARTQAQLRRAQATVECARALGMPAQWELLDPREAASRIGGRGALGGLWTNHCATLDPGRLVRGLARRVERMGGEIFEATAVQEIAPGTVITGRGVVRATTVVRATEAFTASLPGLRRAVVPLYSLVIATSPIEPALLQSLGLTRGIAFNDLRHLRVYGQATDDGRVVFGGRGAPYHLGSRVEPRFDLSPRIHRRLRACLTSLFPDLADVPITHAWGGPLGVPRDWYPSVGIDRSRQLAWAGPYVGDGVAISNLAGRVLANQITETPSTLSALPMVNHRSPLWGPEPTRWLGVNVGLRMAALADTEERVTRRPSVLASIFEQLTGAH
jgi:glycine/D-amino acid oxidase-like deaminating enzyme